MQNFSPSLTAKQKAAGTLNLIGLILLCYFTGQLISQLLTQWLFGFSVEQLANILKHAEQALLNRNIIIFWQTSSAIFSCLLLPAACQYFIQKQTITCYFSPQQKMLPVAVMLTGVLVIVIMPFNALFIEWNKQMQLPGYLSALESHLQQLEQQAAHLTALFTTFTSARQLLVGIIFMALVPAIVEEFFFRGFIQTKFAALYKNKHVAIICTGFLFSLLHFQFYGFLPRMLQGVLFGYLFYWSKNLWYPIIAHLINNGFTVLMYYFWQHKKLPVNITDTALVPLSLSVTCLFIGILVAFTLKRYFSRHLLIA